MKPSIRRRLLANLLVVGILFCALMAWTMAFLARSQVGELLDYQLEQVARTLIDRDLSDLHATRPDDPAMHLEIQIGDQNARPLYASNKDLDLPLTTPLGLTTVPDASGQYDDGLRVFTLRSAHRIVQVIQPVSLRKDLAWEAGFRGVVPAIVLLLALSALIVVMISRELAPLRHLSQELEARGVDALTPITLTDAPAELQAPVLTLNRLLGGLDEAIRAQKDFVADAAHELRTPLTAIRLQAANVATATTASERRSAVAHLTRGVDRASHLVEQLLTLARLDAPSKTRSREVVDLRALAQECLVELAGAASAKAIELTLSAGQPVSVPGDGEALRIMLDNLVGNAVKYAPEGTGVDLCLAPKGEQVAVSVRDHGPGIPAEARERVFDRFHRLDHPEISGTGLGLSIVAAVVRAHDGRIELLDPPHGNGLRVEVHLPVALAAAAGTDERHGPSSMTLLPEGEQSKAALFRGSCRGEGSRRREDSSPSAGCSALALAASAGIGSTWCAASRKPHNLTSRTQQIPPAHGVSP